MTRHKKRYRIKWHSLFQWHRMLGTAAALLFVLLALTGFALNHTDSLRLGQRHVSMTWLLDWYGIAPQTPPVSFRAGSDWVTGLDGRLYFNGRDTGQQYRKLIGAVRLDRWYIIAADSFLLLLNANGQLVEKLTGSTGVPAGMRSLGVTSDGRLAIRGIHGIYTTDRDFLGWQGQQQVRVRWALAETAPADLLGRVLSSFRGQGLTLERVLLDAHSGRLFGSTGVYVVDTAGLILIFLAATGVWMWLRQKRLQKQRMNK